MPAPAREPKSEQKTDLRTDFRLLSALALLTFATGLIDAASVLGLRHVFTANMTGNVVFLGFALVHAGSASAADCLLALGAFLVGATLGGRLASKGVSFTVGLVVEVAILATASALAWVPGGVPRIALAEIALLALAMGLHNASVRKLAVPDMTTTVLTLTLTGLAADSSLAGARTRAGRAGFWRSGSCCSVRSAERCCCAGGSCGRSRRPPRSPAAPVRCRRDARRLTMAERGV